MKNRLLKTLLTVMIALCIVPLGSLKARAGSYYTVKMYLYGVDQPVYVQVLEGESLVETFQKSPADYKKVCKDDPDRFVPYFFEYSNYSGQYDPERPVISHMTLYVRYSHAIHEVKLLINWPTVTAAAKYNKAALADPSSPYTVTDSRWSLTHNGEPWYESSFQADKTYYLHVYVAPKETYLLTTTDRSLKVTVNGIPAGWVTKTFPDEGVHILLKVVPDDSIRSFVRRLYNLCLGREPDEGGFNTWVSALKNKTKTAGEVVYGFFNSAELKKKGLSDGDYVNLCYMVLMNRMPDTSGFEYWVERLEMGISRNFILRGFILSQEFKALCEKYGILPGTIKLTEPRDQNENLTIFVARMYPLVLGRKFDVPGLNNWCKKVLDAKDRRSAIIDMAFGFFHSAEFAKMNTDNKTYVTILYAVFFDRAPDTGGLNDWLKKLSAGMSRDNVLLGFANSPEFTNLLKKYKLL